MAATTRGLSVTLRQRAPVPLDCTLDCAPGELLALVGPSGSGKSTVLRCIAGLHLPAQGRVECGGASWLDRQRGIELPPQQRRVGMVFQNYSLLPHLSALDNVALALWQSAPGQREAEAREWLERVHLHGLERHFPAQLSGGQQQRVALARALARTMSTTSAPESTAGASEPAALLLDEPFSAVDQVTRRKLQQELARLRRELPIPIVLVTHDLDEARMLADRMVLLHHGVSLQSGPPEEVMTRPANTTIARLVGLVNIFEGVVGELPPNGRLVLEWLGRRLEVADNPRPGFARGDKVLWAIPSEGILLHLPGHPSPNEGENPVTGSVADCIVLGPHTQIMFRPDGGAHDMSLTFSAPTHVAQRNGIVSGAVISVTLLAGAIHLMPWSDQWSES
ncbi:MAG: ABC transporter ATP-binding protein [Betaproteobacteria bacterium]|nr:ABC transporter ATP-binding protein [Betaproteobacteria bacterium]